MVVFEVAFDWHMLTIDVLIVNPHTFPNTISVASTHIIDGFLLALMSFMEQFRGSKTILANDIWSILILIAKVRCLTLLRSSRITLELLLYLRTFKIIF